VRRGGIAAAMARPPGAAAAGGDPSSRRGRGGGASPRAAGSLAGGGGGKQVVPRPPRSRSHEGGTEPSLEKTDARKQMSEKTKASPRLRRSCSCEGGVKPSRVKEGGREQTPEKTTTARSSRRRDSGSIFRWSPPLGGPRGLPDSTGPRVWHEASCAESDCSLPSAGRGFPTRWSPPPTEDSDKGIMEQIDRIQELGLSLYNCAAESPHGCPYEEEWSTDRVRALPSPPPVSQLVAPPSLPAPLAPQSGVSASGPTAPSAPLAPLAPVPLAQQGISVLGTAALAAPPTTLATQGIVPLSSKLASSHSWAPLAGRVGDITYDELASRRRRTPSLPGSSPPRSQHGSRRRLPILVEGGSHSRCSLGPYTGQCIRTPGRHLGGSADGRCTVSMAITNAGRSVGERGPAAAPAAGGSGFRASAGAAAAAPAALAAALEQSFLQAVTTLYEASMRDAVPQVVPQQ